MEALNAYHRADCRTREALRRNFLDRYEEHIRAFVKDRGDSDVLVLHVQDPFHRLLLHGVCEFYNLISVTVSNSRDAKLCKTTDKRRNQVHARFHRTSRLSISLRWRRREFMTFNTLAESIMFIELKCGYSCCALITTRDQGTLGSEDGKLHFHKD